MTSIEGQIGKNFTIEELRTALALQQKGKFPFGTSKGVRRAFQEIQERDPHVIRRRFARREASETAANLAAGIGDPTLTTIDIPSQTLPGGMSQVKIKDTTPPKPKGFSSFITTSLFSFASASDMDPSFTTRDVSAQFLDPPNFTSPVPWPESTPPKKPRFGSGFVGTSLSFPSTITKPFIEQPIRQPPEPIIDILPPVGRTPSRSVSQPSIQISRADFFGSAFTPLAPAAKRKKRIKPKRKFRRRPSLVSVELGMTSFAPAFGEFTGLVGRPIIIKRKRKRRKTK